MPEMTENETPTKKQHRKKNRETHNAVERHRKKKINAGINRIGELIPCSPALKQSKNMILDQAFKYITELKRQNDELLLNGGNNEQAEEIKKLRKQLEEIQKENGRYIELLKANDICLYDDPTIHWKGNLKNSKVSVVIPSDQVQKNIIVYSNGSQPGGNSQGTAVQGITFNVGHNLQKQTANVVPVQRTCNLVTPVSISGVYPAENKPWHQTTVSALAANQPVPLCLPATISAQNILELTTSESESSMRGATSGPLISVPVRSEAQQHRSLQTSLSDENSSENKNGQESPRLLRKTVPCGTSAPSSSSATTTKVSHGSKSSMSTQNLRSDFQTSFVVSVTTTVCSQPSRSAGESSSASIGRGRDSTSVTAVVAPSALGGEKTTSPTGTLSAAALDSGWTLSCSLPSSAVSASDLKNINSLTRIPSAGNTQTTWTTLQLAGNTIQPLSQSPSTVVTPVLNESGTCPTTSNLSRHVTTGINSNHSFPADGQTVIEQVVVTLPSGPSLPVQQPLIAPPQVKSQPPKNILPLNSAMQVIQMAQPIGSAVNAAPANQNVIILQPPSTTPCPAVVRAEVPNQTVGQQIVIIQAANQNPLPLLSAPPAGSVRLPVNGASALIGSNSSVQNVSTPQTFGGKHLVHILPRPSSLSTSNSSQTFSVTMSNQQQPQTISLNGQLFALQPVISSAGTTSQTPMQIIQPTTSEDPNTNVALNTFGALASLNQSISQMAGQSCVQLSISQPANPHTAANSQTTPVNVNCVTLTTVASSVTTDNSPTPPSNCNLVTATSVNTVTSLSNTKSKRVNKKPGAKRQSATSKSACPLNPVKEVAKLDCPSTEGSAEPPCNEGLLENLPVVLPSVALSQANSLSVSESHSLDVQHSEAVIPEAGSESKSAEESGLPSQESVMSEPFASAPTKSKHSDPILQETSQDEPPAASTLSDTAKSCTSADALIPSPNEPNTLVSQVPGLSSSTSTTASDCVSEVEIIAEPCRTEQDSSDTMHAAGLLKGQGLTALLSGLAKEKDPPKSSLSAQVDHPEFSSENPRIVEATADLHPKQELLLMGSDEREPEQPHPCLPDQEGIHGSLLTSRQADSPMSTSSGSSRSFSVASMLPGTVREDVISSTATNTCDSCTFVEQTDIVALAARAIFDQENLEKGRAGIPADIRAATTKLSEASSLEEEQSFKAQVSKDNSSSQAEATPNEFSAQDSMETTVERPLVKPSCSVGVKTSAASLQVSTSQPPSLSVNNLIHQNSINHPLVSCAGLSQTSEQTAVPATVNLTVSNNSYGSQPPGPSLMTEYSQEQLTTITGTMSNSQIQEPLLKTSHESRKDSAKRAGQDDLLLSSAKRQKHCQPTPLRLESMTLMNQPADTISEQTQLMVTQIPPNPSSAAGSVSNPAHGDGLARSFPPGNNFIAPALRQTEVQCSSQPSVAEQSQASQHLQALQQHVPAPGVSHLHSNHLYLKQQQQQAGQLRERHHLYQLQHHVSHAESSVHSQPHNVHPQRALQQEAQMQKKRNLVQGTTASQLPLQPKHHGSDQPRPKSGQPHPHHQQIPQQMQQHFGSSQPEKSCENPSTSRNHHSHSQNHLSQDLMHQQQDVGSRQQGSGVSSEHVSGHNPMQRLLTSRGIEQQMGSQPSIVTRSSDMSCTPHRPERNRVSSYSAEALIGKTSSNSEQRMGLSLQGARVSDQLEMRSYLDVPRNKSLAIHNMQGRVDHTVPSDIRLSDCQTFKPGGVSQQPPNNFEVQSSRNNEIGNPVSSLRAMQSQAFRISQNPGPPPIDRQKRLPYPPVQSIPAGNALPTRDSENTCHQSFMQSLLAPHLGDQVIGSQRSLSEHQRNTQCGPSSAIEYSCPSSHESVHIRRESESQNRESCDMSLSAMSTRNSTLNIPFSSPSSSGDIQGRNTSPNVSVQKSNPMRITDSHGTKGHMNPPVTTNMHGVARPTLPHPSVSHGNADQGPPVRQTNSSVPQRSRHPLQDSSGSKIRQPERTRSGNQRHTNVFDPSLPHLPLSTSGSMILGRQQPTTEKRGSIVRFMPDSPQVPNDNSAPDQHTLSQNFGFPFIPEGGMNPPINANTSFIPQVTQPSATRTPALIPVDPQNSLPSFYPPYSPAHPTLSNDISIPYFSNQMFSNPSTEKVNSGSLNNRFGSILSPPRPVGFAQPSFPLLPDMPPMHMTNSHLSNFNMTSLFPEIATALPDGSAMSPLLTITNSSASDSTKQSSNRPAHNISHILGHDCSSAV